MSDLKPCPFCGLVPAEINDLGYRLVHSCGLGQIDCYTKNSVEAMKWNHRPIEDQLRAKLEVAEDEITVLRSDLKFEMEANNKMATKLAAAERVVEAADKFTWNKVFTTKDVVELTDRIKHYREEDN